MKERPIIFSAPMVRAILDGRKTQTRRVVKLGEGWSVDAFAFDATRSPPWRMGVYEAGCAADVGGINCPYGEPGDRLWVRETFVYRHKYDRCYYRADHPKFDPYAHDGWKPSIHMPRRASRITLEVVSVRVERLHDITEADAKSEGAASRIAPGGDLAGAFEAVGDEDATISYRAHFRDLWQSINGADSWAANPWVWVVEFKRVSP